MLAEGDVKVRLAIPVITHLIGHRAGEDHLRVQAVAADCPRYLLAIRGPPVMPADEHQPGRAAERVAEPGEALD